MKLFLLLIPFLAFGVTNKQIENLQLAYKIGKITKAKDGMTFENTLAGIMLTESSARNHRVGDKEKYLVNCSLGIMQVRVQTARYVAKRVQMLSWVDSLSNKRIAHLLLHNAEFSCMIASQYLKLNYNLALKKGYKNPLYRAISRYNGGWNNTEYYERVKKNSKLAKRLKEKR